MKKTFVSNRNRFTMMLLLCSTTLFFMQCQEDELKKTMANTQSACTTLCCDSIRYCGISEQELNQGIANYRDYNWLKTSNYFTSDRTITDYYNAIAPADGSHARTVPFEASEFDARYMDMDIQDLENYLCMIKKTDAKDQVKKIRFYYIRYGDNAPFTEYKNKHSLAIIPVAASGTEIATGIIPKTKEVVGLIFDPAHCETSPIANHNNICPPEPPIGCSDRLRLLDRPQL
nr:hypothetical protein [Chitinophagaceae bacterium]